MSFNTSSFINGVENPWTSSDVAGDQFVTIINAKAAELMVKKDVNGYVDNVYTTTVSAIQSSAVSDNKYAIRFIAFDFMGDATDVSMNVIARVAGGTGKSFTADCTMYDALKSYNSMGIGGSRYASDYDAKKIAGLTIYNIPTNIEITFEAYMTYELNGTPVTSCTKTITFGVGGVAPQA